MTVVAGHTIIEVIPAVIALYDVGSVHIGAAAVVGVLFGTVDNSVTAPVGEVVHRSGIYCIIAHTESSSAFKVVRAVEVYPVSEDVRFTIGDIGIEGQKRVKNLFFHVKLLLIKTGGKRPARK